MAMIHITVGEDWYGGVKQVAASRVATGFFHVCSFPCYPIYSAIISPSGACEPDWEYLHLARIDWSSVFIAYVRAVSGMFMVFGSIPLLFGLIFWLTDAHTDIPPVTILGTGGLIVAVGTIIGALSYLVWRVPSHRERAIRQVAATLMTVAADPAILMTHFADEWIERIDPKLAEQGIRDYRTAVERAHEYPKTVRQLLLLRVRAEIGAAGNDALLELQTDQLLRSL